MARINVKRDLLPLVAKARVANSFMALVEPIRETFANKGGHWSLYADKLIQWLEDGADIERAPFTVVARNGNSKLPFYAYSSLAIADCPGMGACASYCYSVKAWRYPAAFMRQLQNSILQRFRADALKTYVVNYFTWQFARKVQRAYKKNPLPAVGQYVQPLDFRLYVDGDFDSVNTLTLWMDALRVLRGRVNAYGYSKSWELLTNYAAEGNEFPSNYRLNISGGSRYDKNPFLKEQVKQLTCTRGEFNAVPVTVKQKDQPELYKQQVKAQATGFVCPGKCGSCVLVNKSNVHACGSERFNGVPILIGIH